MSADRFFVGFLATLKSLGENAIATASGEHHARFDSAVSWMRFYTSAGCNVEPANSRIVCGGVGPGAQVDVYLGGDVTTRGTFRYAVKFADVSSGSPIYVNQHPDGTHDVVSWTEVIS